MSNPIRVADMTQGQLRSTIQSAVFVAVFAAALVFGAIGVLLRVLL